MNEYLKVRSEVVGKFKSDPLVNTLTMLKNDIVDTNKENIYPIVNIDYAGSDLFADVLHFRFKVKALDQLEIYTSTIDSKMKEDTNELDVLNETYNICQTFINSYRQYTPNLVEMVSLSSITQVEGQHLNGLAGHEFECTLVIPNEGASWQ